MKSLAVESGTSGDESSVTLLNKVAPPKNLEKEEDDHHYSRLVEGNKKLIAVSRTPLLCISSGSEALSLLLSSERVYNDMIDWLKYGEPEQIVLRQWEPELQLEYEFRAFIYKGKLTAISQYDHYCVYPGK